MNAQISEIIGSVMRTCTQIISAIRKDTKEFDCHIKLVALDGPTSSKVLHEESMSHGDVSNEWQVSTVKQSDQARQQRRSLTSQKTDNDHQTVTLIYSSFLITVTARDEKTAIYIAQMIGSAIIFFQRK